MNTIDYLYYTSWIYLSTLILIELIIYDFPARINVHKKSNVYDSKTDKAVNYYLKRKKYLLYKITPIFCLFQVVSIIANILLKVSLFRISPILLLILAILLVVIQTKKNVQVVKSLKTIKASNFSEKKKALASIFMAHLITFILLIGMLACYSFGF